MMNLSKISLPLNLHRLAAVLFAVSLSANLSACEDDPSADGDDADDDDDDDDDDEEEGDDDDDEAAVCDPEGEHPEMGELLNAPVEDDVEVIEKEPQHPGDPGPEDLP